MGRWLIWLLFEVFEMSITALPTVRREPVDDGETLSDTMRRLRAESQARAREHSIIFEHAISELEALAQDIADGGEVLSVRRARSRPPPRAGADQHPAAAELVPRPQGSLAVQIDRVADHQRLFAVGRADVGAQPVAAAVAGHGEDKALIVTLDQRVGERRAVRAVHDDVEPRAGQSLHPHLESDLGAGGCGEAVAHHGACRRRSGR